MGNPLYEFDIYLVNVKTIRMIAQTFVAFSEKLNFNGHLLLYEGRFIYYRRVVNNYLKLGGQVVMPDAAAAASALLFRQTWVGNRLFCPPTHH